MRYSVLACTSRRTRSKFLLHRLPYSLPSCFSLDCTVCNNYDTNHTQLSSYQLSSSRVNTRYRTNGVPHIIESQETHPQLSSSHAAAQRGVSPCGAAVPCCALSLVHVKRMFLPTTAVRTIQHAASMSPGAWSSWHLQVACLHLDYRIPGIKY